MELQKNGIYQRHECAVFLKTNEGFGGLSNMAGGYPLSMNGIRILTSEALYQACRFPHMPDVQKLIIGQSSPMTAKMKSKPYRKDSRPDWDEIRVQIMHWCLRVKLVQNWEKFSALLLSTGNRPIVEESYRDPFWGAKPVDSESLVGVNVLGQLLTELRDELKGPDVDILRVIEPPAFPKFLLIGKPIGAIRCPTLQASSLHVSVSSNPPCYEQLALNAHTSVAKSNTVESEEMVIQKLHQGTASSLPSVPALSEPIHYQLPLEGFDSAASTEKSTPKIRHKKAS